MYEVSGHADRIFADQMQSSAELINKLMNEKLQAYWHAVQTQLDKIRN